MSIARAHREHAEAVAMAAAESVGGVVAPPADGPLASAYELKRAALGIDLRRLRDIESLERKIDAKRDMIGQYVDHVQGWLDAAIAAANGEGSVVDDEIVMTMMIWLIDTGDFDRALDIAEVALKHGLTLPERYQRKLNCLVAEEIADAALKAFGPAGDGRFDSRVLMRVAALTEGGDMPDQVRAKLFKAIGLAARAEAEAIEPGSDGPAGARETHLRLALDNFRRALALDANVGVKKTIEQLDRALAKEPPAS